MTRATASSDMASTMGEHGVERVGHGVSSRLVRISAPGCVYGGGPARRHDHRRRVQLRHDRRPVDPPRPRPGRCARRRPGVSRVAARPSGRAAVPMGSGAAPRRQTPFGGGVPAGRGRRPRPAPSPARPARIQREAVERPGARRGTHPRSRPASCRPDDRDLAPLPAGTAAGRGRSAWRGGRPGTPSASNHAVGLGAPGRGQKRVAGRPDRRGPGTGRARVNSAFRSAASRPSAHRRPGAGGIITLRACPCRSASAQPCNGPRAAEGGPA